MVLVPVFGGGTRDKGDRPSSVGSEHAAARTLNVAVRGTSRAAVHIARSAAALETLELTTSERAAILSEVNFDSQALVILFAGTRPTGGYSLRLENATREGTRIVLRIGERRPEPGAMVTQALTFPVIAVVIDDPPPEIVVEGPPGR